MEHKTRPSSGADRDLRRARDRFSSPATFSALNDCINEVIGTDIFDAERIIGQLGNRLAEFKSIPTFQGFRAACIAWASRQAKLTVMLRSLVQQHQIADEDSTLLFTSLPEFAGDADDPAALKAWATAMGHRQDSATESLASWIRIHASAVRRGLRKVLCDCRDLEVCVVDEEDQLFSEVWMHVAEQAVRFLALSQEGKLAKALYWEAFRRAHLWKDARLAQIKSGERPKPFVHNGLEDLEATLAYYRGAGKLPPRPFVIGPGDATVDCGLDGLGDVPDSDEREDDVYDLPDEIELLAAA